MNLRIKQKDSRICDTKKKQWIRKESGKVWRLNERKGKVWDIVGMLENGKDKTRKENKKKICEKKILKKMQKRE